MLLLESAADLILRAAVARLHCRGATAQRARAFDRRAARAGDCRREVLDSDE